MLDDVSLAVEAGEFVAIAGPNGGGKTTLLRLVLGLERPPAGTVRVFGEPAGRVAAAPRIGYLPQRAQLVGDAPGHRARGRLGRPARAAAGLVGPLRRADRDAVDARDRARRARRAAPTRRCGRSPAGMQQRAFIAKALASEPALLALDEPTTGVDAESQESLAALLDELRAELGVTILYVSHEFGAVEHVVERLVLVRGGDRLRRPARRAARRLARPVPRHDH